MSQNIINRDSERLAHILDCCTKIENYVSNSDRDEKTQEAIERNLTIIGEACRVVSDELKAKYPLIPWAEIRGMRNILVHEYYITEAETVWDVAEHKIPALKNWVEKIMEGLEDKQ